jgi:hypothetical protein
VIDNEVTMLPIEPALLEEPHNDPVFAKECVDDLYFELRRLNPEVKSWSLSKHPDFGLICRIDFVVAEFDQTLIQRVAKAKQGDGTWLSAFGVATQNQ